MWKSMLGGLPCLSVDEDCVTKLQVLATKNNGPLSAIDERIKLVEDKIAEAQSGNKSSIRASLLTPLLQSWLQVQTTPTGEKRGILSRIAGLFSSPISTVNEILGLVGVPLFQNATGGGDAAQGRSISIADLQVKIATVKGERAKMALALESQISLTVLDWDVAARDYQITSEIARREATKLKIIEIGYRLGRGDTVQYMGQLSVFDGKKAETFRSWAKMRSQIARLKLLCLKGKLSEEEET